MHHFMKPSIFKLLILVNLFVVESNGQEIAANSCDSILLGKQEYDKCKLDSVFTADIIVQTNYIIKFKTSILPKCRLQRRDLNIPTPLQQSLTQLKIIYDSVLNKKLSRFQTDMNRNQKYVQPKAYISSLLSQQTFRFYPDIYAVLLNEIHLQLAPKTTREEFKMYKRVFDKTIKDIPFDLQEKLIKITSEINTENNKLMGQGVTKIFQGSIEEGYRKQCDVINFLLWRE